MEVDAVFRVDGQSLLLKQWTDGRQNLRSLASIPIGLSEDEIERPERSLRLAGSDVNAMKKNASGRLRCSDDLAERMKHETMLRGIITSYMLKIQSRVQTLESLEIYCREI
jgi:hypothetical protein